MPQRRQRLDLNCRPTTNHFAVRSLVVDIRPRSSTLQCANDMWRHTDRSTLLSASASSGIGRALTISRTERKPERCGSRHWQTPATRRGLPPKKTQCSNLVFRLGPVLASTISRDGHADTRAFGSGPSDTTGPVKAGGGGRREARK